MAYAAVASLMRTLFRFGRDASGHISLAQNSSEGILRSVFDELRSVAQALDKLNRSSSTTKSSSKSRSINRERLDALDGQIREVLSQFEDFVDFHVSDQFHSQVQVGDDGMINPLSFTLDFEQLSQQFYSFYLTVNELKAEYLRELGLEEGEEDLDDEEEDLGEEEEGDLEMEAAEQVMNVVPSIADHHFGGDDESDSDDMVELPRGWERLKNRITENDNLSAGSGWKITFITGMAGIGKTTAAKKLFRDPEITSRFERRAFVTIGQKYRLEAVLVDILRRLIPEKVSLMESELQQKSAAFLKRMVYQSLKNRSCFIVLDDLWHQTIWNELKSVFPNNFNNNCQVLLTSRLRKVASLASPSYVRVYCTPFLDKIESWNLLRKKVFGDQESSCPPQLVKAGQKIAQNCDGLPLTIVKVANILSAAADRTPEFWNDVAGKKKHPVFIDAYEQMFEVLYLSYDYLPQQLKPFFLYIGVFPQNYEIPCSVLTNLWCGEVLYGTVESLVVRCLIKLYNRNLVLFHQKGYNGCSTKKIRLHSVYWYMCNKLARKTKFFYCLNNCADTLAEDMKIQRRLCIQNNVLFGIKDVRNSISSISTVRSLLCTGEYHQYPVPICVGLRLLKVLHALTIRFYEFPMEVLNRVNLMYLSLTLDAKLPSSISRLYNLKYLIVSQHVRIVKSPSYLPMKIWNMNELEHLQVMGSDIPDPCEGSHDDQILPNLLVLSDVSAQSCTKGVFKRIPRLYKLGVRIELTPDEDEPLCFFDDISHLHGLHKLKCIMATPKIVSGVVAPPAPLSIFSLSLWKLTLSGMGYPWEEMRKISSLPNLHILKLRCYAFRGPKWVVVDKGFHKLNTLFIEDTDLVKWTSLQDYYSLKNLERLIVKHCYKLQEIPTTLFGESLKAIEIVDCNPLAHTCAEQLTEHLDKHYPRELPVDLLSVHRGLIDGKNQSPHDDKFCRCAELASE